MSPKAKVDRSAESGDPAEAPANATEVFSDPSPFDSAEFLEANRRNRDKIRAAAEAKRAKEAARDQRRAGRGGGAEADSGEAPLRRGVGWLVPVLSVLLIAALVATGVLAYLYREADNRVAQEDQLNQLRAGAVEVAGQYAVELLTYDSANFAELDSRITDISTPAFGKDFIESSRQAREGAAGAQAVASAKVKDAALQSVSPSKAVVLVAMDQTVKSPQTDAQVPEGIPYQSMVKVTLERLDGTWRLADLAVV